MPHPNVLPLRAATLPRLSGDGRIAVPGYDRSALRVGIVHFGVGGFHRSHEAMYLDRLMSVTDATDWGICGVGLLPGDEQMGRVLADQDHLYTLVIKHAD